MSIYLILHKVRGEPAFDIAERCEEMGTESDPGPWWIVPTSGHRARPYIYWRLDSTLDIGPSWNPQEIIQGHNDWLDWPDHYTTTTRPSIPDRVKSILGIVGLGAERKFKLLGTPR